MRMSWSEFAKNIAPKVDAVHLIIQSFMYSFWNTDIVAKVSRIHSDENIVDCLNFCIKEMDFVT